MPEVKLTGLKRNGKLTGLKRQQTHFGSAVLKPDSSEEGRGCYEVEGGGPLGWPANQLRSVLLIAVSCLQADKGA